MISVDYHEKVALARLNRNVTNALSLSCLHELDEVLQSVEKDPGVHGLVLGSSNEKFFSIGFDIPELFDLNRNDFINFFRRFNQVCMNLFTLPKPTVAAITGHAVAGGCILSLCCDYRFIAEGRKLMGLNEVKLGVPVPYLADRILHSLAGAGYARKMMEGGEFYAPAETLGMGVVDKVLPVEAVLKRAIEHVGNLGSPPEPAYAALKKNRVDGTAVEVRAREPDKERHFIECWYSEETRRLLREAMEKF
ncbi:MAG: enoyl-CoA hydratase/isomerase family protein [Pseudomonadota bacterium]